MSQKNETTVLLLSLLITVALIAGGWWWFTKNNNNSAGNPTTPKAEPATSNQPVENRISAGEKLLSSDTTPQKKAAADAIAKSNYSEAVKQLEQARKANRNEPENLIYLNNARIGNQKSYNIAVAVPLSSDLNSAQEILRGVAQRQEEINRQGGIKGVPLKVLIADDDNKPAVAEQVANALVKNPDILGVVGHFASDVTLPLAKFISQDNLWQFHL